jgi:predicted Zn-dependent protease
MSMGYNPRRRMSLLMRFLPILLGLLAVGFIAVRGCQEGPFGRKQIVALSHEEEAALGAQAFQQVLRESQLVPEGPLTQAVRRVALRLTNAARKPEFLEPTKLKPQEFQWDLRVLRSKEVNAFCLPGGKMVVYTGILPIAETEGGLAVVLGHEIAHALGHHGAERMAQQQMAQVGVTAAAGSIADLDPGQQQFILQALNAGAKFGILKYSRSHESEADRLGLYLMSVAGYDPREAPRFWQRMTAAAGNRQQPPEFASTHPSHERRIADLEEWQKEVMPIFKAAEPAPDANRRLPLTENWPASPF